MQIKLGDVYINFFEFIYGGTSGYGISIRVINKIDSDGVWMEERFFITNEFRRQNDRGPYNVWIPRDKFKQDCEQNGFEKYDTSIENSIWKGLWDTMKTPDGFPVTIYEKTRY